MNSSRPKAETVRSVAWAKQEPFGAEFVTVALEDGAMRATGVAIGSEPEPYRLEYALKSGGNYLTTHTTVKTTGDGWERTLELERRDGEWIGEGRSIGNAELPAPGGDLRDLHGALDPDLGLSPLFNSLPVLRHELHLGGAAHDFLMIWISVPDLSIHASPQRYAHVHDADRAHVVRFEATGEGESFTADIAFDDDGLVLDYPGIGRRLDRSPTR